METLLFFFSFCIYLYDNLVEKILSKNIKLNLSVWESVDLNFKKNQIRTRYIIIIDTC